MVLLLTGEIGKKGNKMGKCQMWKTLDKNLKIGAWLKGWRLITGGLSEV